MHHASSANRTETNERKTLSSRAMASDSDDSSKGDNDVPIAATTTITTASTPQNAKKRQRIHKDKNSSQKSRRRICDRCHRPLPTACLCESLPNELIRLKKTEIVVLQHPLEIKNHKAASHRSLPLLELCLHPESLELCKGRRFGKDSLSAQLLMKLQNAKDYLPVLVFPKLPLGQQANYNEEKADVWSLTKLQRKMDAEPSKRILLLVLDATWKHAREMHIANLKADQYPKHMLRVSLEREDLEGFKSGRFQIRGKASQKGYSSKRSDRTEALENDTWMSTAECIAWIVSKLEASSTAEESSLYEILMKPMDAMVEKWKSFRKTDGN